MKPTTDASKLKKTKVTEHLLRFLLGGVITAATGIVAHAFGPMIGGLFLAFPAILPASLTLVKDHDGRRCAVEDARGAVLGALGLLAFVAVVLLLGETAVSPAVTLVAAALAWGGASVALWIVVYGRS